MSYLVFAWTVLAGVTAGIMFTRGRSKPRGLGYLAACVAVSVSVWPLMLGIMFGGRARK